MSLLCEKSEGVQQWVYSLESKTDDEVTIYFSYEAYTTNGDDLVQRVDLWPRRAERLLKWLTIHKNFYIKKRLMG